MDSLQWTSMDNRLIEEVLKHPILYDRTKEGSRRSEVKLDAWREVTQSLFKTDHPLLLEKVRSKWKNLRDTYIKAKRRRSGGPCKPWKFETEMSFLLPYLDPKVLQPEGSAKKRNSLSPHHLNESKTKEVKEEDEDELEECDAMAHVEAVMEEETPEDRKGPGQDGSRRELQDCSSVYPVTQLVRGQLDSIDTFFLGLAGTVKKLKPVNQIKLKKAIAILVFDAELQETSNRASTFS